MYKTEFNLPFWFLFVVVSFFSGTSIFAYNEKNVLVLNSYHEGYTWTDDLTRGIHDVFANQMNVSVFIEYMDTKRFNVETYLGELDRVYKAKYTPIGLDLILCTDNNALDFIIDHYGEPPYICPVVYCGVSNYEEYRLDTLPFYGITELINFEDDVNCILQVLPETKQIFYIFDQTETGNIYYKDLLALKKKMNDVVELHLINDIDVNTIADFVSGLSVGSVIRYLNTHRDKYGEPVDDLEIARLIAKHANVPVMAGELSHKVDGFLGGLMNIGYEHGAESAELAIKILEGKDRQILKKLYFSEPEFYIDYRVMKRWGIKSSSLPDDTILMNSPTSFFYKYRFQIIGIAAFVFFLLLAIILLVLNNIQKKKAQVQLTHAKLRAEESDKLKSAFLANMSHEIRTPLNSIVGFSRLLADRHNNDKTSERYIEYITSSTNSLLNLINDILDISKIEVGQLEINKKKVDISRELDNLYSIFDHKLFMAKKHAVELKYRPGYDDEYYIHTDAVRLQQIMTNLLTNAIKFTEEGSIEFGFRVINDCVLFFCFDTGKGIPTEQQEFIFKRFVKLNDSESYNPKGTGLGLSITKNLVELLGGKIWVESESGKGSRFYFTLPNE